jgi:galacturan 1,4-alpha-galacturonidase
MIFQTLAIVAALLPHAFTPALAALVKEGSVCTVTPLSATLKVRDDMKRQARVDDTPQMLDAFKQCGQNASIIFQPGTYNIRQVMETTSLRNVTIDIYGKFLWSADNLQYWIANTLPVTAFSLTTAWKLGGRDIIMRGHGKALFDGNGQVWIDENKDGSNRKGRPINLTIWRANNVFIDGITWRQSQFWHTFVAYSQNITMTNLDMNTTSNSRWSSVNTDGVDTWNSKDVYIRNWTVTCGDVCFIIIQSEPRHVGKDG